MSLRLVMSAGAMLLVVATVVGVGQVAERNLRRTLNQEIRTRLQAEARNLANFGSDALLDDFPELGLMPVVQQTALDRPELAFVTVVDREDRIQGDVDPRRHGHAFAFPGDLVITAGSEIVGSTLREGSDLIVASRAAYHGAELLGWSHVALRRDYVDQVVADSRRPLLLISAVFLVIAALAAVAFMHLMLRPVAGLREGLERIGRGDLETPMKLRDRTELGLLADTVNDMASSIRDSRQTLLEKERLDHEMNLAHRIQASLMPDARVRAGRFFGLGLFESAAEVGGDFFDVYELPGQRLGVFVADVAGKGLGGCLVTSMLAAMVRAHREAIPSPRDLLARLDRDLAGYLEPGVFVTAFCGVLDTDSGRFTFASAAHCPLMLARGAIGEVESYRTEGVPLGILPHAVVEESLKDHTALLSPGDRALIYTDGLTEAPRSGDGAQFGEERVLAQLKERADDTAGQVLLALRDSVNAWEGSASHADDLTLLLLGCDRATDIAAAGALPAAGAGANLRLEDINTEAALEELIASCRRFELGPEPVRVEDLDAWLRQGGCEDVNLLVHALYEYLSNVQEHGFLPTRRSGADVWSAPAGSDHPLAGRYLVRDRGRACPPESVPSPDMDDPEVRTRGRGLGWELIRMAVQDVDYTAVPAVGNLCLLTPRTGAPEEEMYV